MNRNPNCSGGHCASATGEVRVYPLGGGANQIFCHACWAHENRYRYERGDPAKWPQLNWNEADVYGADTMSTARMVALALQENPRAKK